MSCCWLLVICCWLLVIYYLFLLVSHSLFLIFYSMLLGSVLRFSIFYFSFPISCKNSTKSN
ncbi:MAG TPA: hypothetical protein DEG17_11480 [Cyanobacteria bacterium UBA11149]|nr:hypothetical protein [Cyanobacteria bacterium UBA11367]HBE60318.1 hypothetical protein [Cyanobacteria bacterium UBA11366]HBR73077.1 hypothetical protein [Cyanobacteria bacterium UBA11159]HBS71005.1 hypothetical protein [Cyanobacteria bacterium UBA11153]HBW89468.1 hypothetical protein [Cyanobacteria bacterium UBA11149]HCA97920.1 hypothetical protein [Cyanobacteria bacterium UBA9226]